MNPPTHPPSPNREGMIPNRPSEEGATLGEHLARMTETALARLKKEFPNHQEPCGTCAFRRGTFPNRCASTVMDALKCVLERRDFFCHESGKLCCGYMIALRATAALPAMKAPWNFSLSPQQIEKLETGSSPGSQPSTVISQPD